MPVGETFPLGDGELTIGVTATPIDVSCLVNNAVITASKDQGDETVKLCGTVKPGSIKYTYELSGNIDVDIADPAGLFALSQDSPGQEFDYVFTPNTVAATSATGKLILDPLDFGGDETGQTMTSDFAFALIGAPTYAIAGLPLTASAETTNGKTSSTSTSSTSSEAAA